MMLLFYIFSVCIAVQTIFAVWMLWASGGSKEQNSTVNSEPLSIIICAKNEAENLRNNLPDILQQQHPDFEVIVVNDYSDDDTILVLEQLKSSFLNLVILNILNDEQRNFPGKKYALSKGIAIAKNENLLFCDADCKPSSADWAAIMSNHFSDKKEIIAGYGPYKEAKGWLNKFIRWETLHTFIQYSSYAKTGIPYMAVGRNLACKKSPLIAAQTSPIWSSMPSGDDDLLIRLMGNSKNVAIVSDTDSFTYSDAKTTFSDWINQKQRHLSTGKLYKKNIQFLLGIYGLSHGLMWLLWLVLWIAGYSYLISSLMLLRCILVWSLWAFSADNLKEKKLIIWLPFCDLAWAFYNLFLSPYIFFKTKKQWK